MTDAVSATLGIRPGKIIAVHLNYPSRAAQRGRTPAFGSYFLKAPTSLAAHGAAAVRPAGTELLGFEGEIALVIGTDGRNIAPGRRLAHVGWVTAANDLGLYDLRYADRGSNLRSKSADGYTPIGPALLDAAGLDPAGLRVRTWVNGELVQDDTSDDPAVPLRRARRRPVPHLTLERGDVILTGTPPGPRSSCPGDVVEVEVDSRSANASTGRLRTTIVDGPPLAPVRRAAEGGRRAAGRRVRAGPAADPAPAHATTCSSGCGRVAVATLSAQLRRRGLDNVSIDGVHPTRPGARFAGRARTLRYLPLREDLFEQHGGGFNAQKRAIEAVGPGDVLVMEARGERGTGTVGDILALRAQVRGAAAIVTDGGVRDSAAVAALDIPVFHAGPHPAVLGRRHVPVGRSTSRSPAAARPCCPATSSSATTTGCS